MSLLGSVFNSALSSLIANQYALTVASNNIANASNPNYSRQRLITHPAGPDGGAWGIGMGVSVAGVQSLRDTLLDERLQREVSARFGADTLAGRMSKLEALFNDSEGTGLLEHISAFFNSFQTLSQDPASVTLREQVKIRANALIQAFHVRSQDLAEVRAAADAAIGYDIGVVNRLTAQIAGVTREIKTQELAAPATDLRDKRAALVKELSQYVEVNELEYGTTYQLSTRDNQLLVMDHTAFQLTASDVTAAIGEGSLKSELEARDVYLPKYQASLDQMAYEITQQVNSIHSAAYDLDGNTGINFFAPLAAASGAAQLIGLSAEVTASARSIVASNLATGHDNDAAIALGNLLHANVFTGGSITDQYGALVFAIGSDTASAESSLAEHDSLLVQLENRRQSISGVSIEEETVQMLQFQRAYEASARLIRTVDELLQITLAIGE